MKVILILLAVVVVAGAIVAVGTFTLRKGEAPRSERDVTVEKFLAVLPPNLTPEKRDEIWRLFQSLWNRADRNVVDIEDIDILMRELRKHIERGYIEEKDLHQVMAMVGYFSYKNDPDFTLPDSDIDHPLLNPEAGKFKLAPDSTFWEEFEAWKKQRADSLARADTT